jgi:hypothetical protein
MKRNEAAGPIPRTRRPPQFDEHEHEQIYCHDLRATDEFWPVGCHSCIVRDEDRKLRLRQFRLIRSIEIGNTGLWRKICLKLVSHLGAMITRLTSNKPGLFVLQPWRFWRFKVLEPPDLFHAQLCVHCISCSEILNPQVTTAVVEKQRAECLPGRSHLPIPHPKKPSAVSRQPYLAHLRNPRQKKAWHPQRFKGYTDESKNRPRAFCDRTPNRAHGPPDRRPRLRTLLLADKEIALVEEATAR